MIRLRLFGDNGTLLQVRNNNESSIVVVYGPGFLFSSTAKHGFLFNYNI